MIRKLKKAALKLSILSLLVVPFGVVGTAMAQEPSTPLQNSTCQGSDLQFPADGSAPTCEATTGTGQTRINELITQIINVFSILVGIVAVVMMIYGGFRYITSGGDSGNVTSAKNTILYAIIGLIIVALAQFIVKFVLNKATQAPTT